jgi:hypothetical protein
MELRMQFAIVSPQRDGGEMFFDVIGITLLFAAGR